MWYARKKNPLTIDVVDSDALFIYYSLGDDFDSIFKPLNPFCSNINTDSVDTVELLCDKLAKWICFSLAILYLAALIGHLNRA